MSLAGGTGRLTRHACGEEVWRLVAIAVVSPNPFPLSAVSRHRARLASIVSGSPSNWFADGVGHNCALDGIGVINIGDDWHSRPVVGEVALPVGVALDEHEGSQSAGFGCKGEAADSAEQINVGVFMVVVHGPPCLSAAFAASNFPNR